MNVCFANPGTSEMHLVSAIDKAEGMRAVLGLHESVVTGAADGYGRMTGKPALTILHLGPGLANGTSNLHNAKKASSPVINLIGEHATFHRKLNAPLQSDIESLAGTVSHVVRTCESPDDLPGAAFDAIRTALSAPGKIASIIIPADAAWGDTVGDFPVPGIKPVAEEVPDKRIREIAGTLKKKEETVILMNGSAVASERGLSLAGRIAKQYGARLYIDTFCRRLPRGEGRAVVTRLPYFPEGVINSLEGTRNLILVGTGEPVSFFAYRGKPGVLVPEGCSVSTLCKPQEDPIAALSRLADELDTPEGIEERYELKRPPLPEGKLDHQKASTVIAALMPENCIVSDESNTSGASLLAQTEGAPGHDWLFLTGGSIGQCLPLGTGAAVACPHRKVICLESDGSAMFSIQAIWTMAREKLDVTVVIFSNRSYGILKIEFMRIFGEAPGKKGEKLFDLDSPSLDFVSIAKGMGMKAHRAGTVSEFAESFGAAMEGKGPVLIEAVLS